MCSFNSFLFVVMKGILIKLQILYILLQVVLIVEIKGFDYYEKYFEVFLKRAKSVCFVVYFQNFLTGKGWVEDIFSNRFGGEGLIRSVVYVFDKIMVEFYLFS